MNQFVDLSIIVPSYNTKRLLRECLNSVFASLEGTSINYEVIVVDNASIDGSPTIVREEFTKVKLLLNEQNVGYGKANNQGVAQAKGKYVFFLNSDIYVLERSIEKMYLFITKQTGVDIVGGKLFNTDQSAQPSCGPFYNLPVVFGALFLKGDYWGLTRYSPETVREVDWVSGACMLMFRRVYDKIGGFDEHIFMYMDEIELLYRAKKQGYHAFFYPEARFIHYGSASSEGKAEPIRNVFHGLVYFYKKHRSAVELAVLRILLSLKATIGYSAGLVLRKHQLLTTYGKSWHLIWD